MQRSFMVMLGEYSSLAFVLPAATVIGWGAGYLLDRAFHTSFLYMVFLILGIAAGFVQLIRTVTRKPHGD